MAHRKKHDTGPQQHAEGQHGEKTHRRFIEQLHESSTQPTDDTARRMEGHRRLEEDREQHDEAEKNSESGKTE